MPAYFRDLICNFITRPNSEIFHELASRNAEARFSLTPEAIHAWEDQLPFLKAAFSQLVSVVPDSQNWTLLLEYPVPQVGQRLDLVVLAHQAILAIEIKTGVSPTAARRQVEDYAISLACFHEASEGREIVPLVVSNAHTSAVTEVSGFETLIRSCRFAGTLNLGEALIDICGSVVDRTLPPIDPLVWDGARFRPIPPIIDAAVKLYSGMEVFELGHAAAPRVDLEKTTTAVTSIVQRAKETGGKAICFVTGVPGAGKTLVGLNAVHQAELKDESLFLSGNGPLVKIIREALIRDVVKRQGVSRRQAETTLHAFIANVHRFADQFSSNEQPPSKNVIVFDEAQRAWDKKQNTRPARNGRRAQRNVDASEPEMILQIMNRLRDWAVIVALIGGGQEINSGEAGLGEWGRALAKFPEWKVFASPEVLKGGSSVKGFRLFEESITPLTAVIEVEDLHLNVSVRSVRAHTISEWVNAVLDGDSFQAKNIATKMGEKPSVTRSISVTRAWLSARQLGLTRSGLVASASATRLRADGLESSFDFHKGFEWAHWFLDRADCAEIDCDHKYCSDVRASSKLEVCATQFEIQGLELDWIGLCWGEDLIRDGGNWRSQKFNNKKWTVIKPEIRPPESRARSEIKHLYRLNAYRVLLTRARQGMIIYIPQPHSDPSRSPERLDATYQFLLDCGAMVTT